MNSLNNADFVNILANIYILVIVLFTGIIIILSCLITKLFYKIKTSALLFSNTGVIKLLSLIFYLIAYLILLNIVYLFYKLNNDFSIKISVDPYFLNNCIFNYFPLFIGNFSVDLFGLVILFVAFTVGFLCLIALGNKYFHENENIFLYFFFFY